MNITISARSKSLNYLPNQKPDSTEAVQKTLLQQQKLNSKRESVKPECEYPHLPKWLMGKCFAKSNSILQQQPSPKVPHHKQVIHCLSSKKFKQRPASPSQNQSTTLSTMKYQTISKDRKIKIKLETSKDRSKNGSFLRLKACKATINSTPLKNSQSSSTNASRQKLNERIMKAIQKESQAKQIGPSAYLENARKTKHIWQIGSEQKHKIQDCIYEPIFSLKSQAITLTGIAKSYRAESQKYASSESVCQGSLVITKGQDQIINMYNEESFLEEKLVQHFSKQQKMFVIYQKNDENIENQ